LGELHWYINQDPPPSDAGTAMETLEYLEACSLLFERGFLSHDRVRDTNAEVLCNINKGFCYFTKWLDSILSKGNDDDRMNAQVDYFLFNRPYLSTYFKHPEIFFVMAE